MQALFPFIPQKHLEVNVGREEGSDSLKNKLEYFSLTNNAFINKINPNK